MASILSSLVKAVLEMDHVSTEVSGDTTIYTFKTTGLFPSLAEVKAKILSMLDLPFDIPAKVEVEEVKRGPIFKEYLVRIYVSRTGIGRLRDLFKRERRPLRERLRRAT